MKPPKSSSASQLPTTSILPPDYVRTPSGCETFLECCKLFIPFCLVCALQKLASPQLKIEDFEDTLAALQCLTFFFKWILIIRNPAFMPIAT